MQHRVTYNNFSLRWVLSSLMLVTVSVMAESNDSQYSLQLAAEQSNPWALPQVPAQSPVPTPTPAYGGHPGYQAAPKYYNQDAQQERRHSGQYPEQQNKIWRNPGDRFVTPEILDSLKQQQRKYQIMPKNQQHMEDRYQPRSQQFMQMPPASGMSGQGVYDYPSYGAGSYGTGSYGTGSYGTGSANPLFDAPAVSPWGDGADVLYRGQSLPMVPNEAMGGFPPMHVPSFGMNTYKGAEPGGPIGADESDVFNPFTFLPGGGFGKP